MPRQMSGQDALRLVKAYESGLDTHYVLPQLIRYHQSDSTCKQAHEHARPSQRDSGQINTAQAFSGTPRKTNTPICEALSVRHRTDQTSKGLRRNSKHERTLSFQTACQDKCQVRTHLGWSRPMGWALIRTTCSPSRYVIISQIPHGTW